MGARLAIAAAWLAFVVHSSALIATDFDHESLGVLQYRSSVSSLGANPNKRYFTISQWSDIGCNTTQLWNFTEEAGVCVNLHGHSSDWVCPPIPRNAGIRWIKYTSYKSSDCTGTPVWDHFNFCGECKNRVLRECVNGGQYVNIFNCSDQDCKVCPSPPTKMEPSVCIDGTPLPRVEGYHVVMEGITSDIESMYHQRYSGNGECQSSADPTQQHGWDLIALNRCNKGWMFQCL